MRLFERVLYAVVPFFLVSFSFVYGAEQDRKSARAERALARNKRRPDEDELKLVAAVRSSGGIRERYSYFCDMPDSVLTTILPRFVPLRPYTFLKEVTSSHFGGLSADGRFFWERAVEYDDTYRYCTFTVKDIATEKVVRSYQLRTWDASPTYEILLKMVWSPDMRHVLLSCPIWGSAVVPFMDGSASRASQDCVVVDERHKLEQSDDGTFYDSFQYTSDSMNVVARRTNESQGISGLWWWNVVTRARIRELDLNTLGRGLQDGRTLGTFNMSKGARYVAAPILSDEKEFCGIYLHDLLGARADQMVEDLSSPDKDLLRVIPTARGRVITCEPSSETPVKIWNMQQKHFRVGVTGYKPNEIFRFLFIDGEGGTCTVSNLSRDKHFDMVSFWSAFSGMLISKHQLSRKIPEGLYGRRANSAEPGPDRLDELQSSYNGTIIAAKRLSDPSISFFKKVDSVLSLLQEVWIGSLLKRLIQHTLRERSATKALERANDSFDVAAIAAARQRLEQASAVNECTLGEVQAARQNHTMAFEYALRALADNSYNKMNAFMIPERRRKIYSLWLGVLVEKFPQLPEKFRTSLEQGWCSIS